MNVSSRSTPGVVALEQLRRKWPELYACIDPERAHLISTEVLASIDIPLADDFADSDVNGRGDMYREAQANPTMRIKGIKSVFALAHPDERLESLTPAYKIADLLGGDGTLVRALRTVLDEDSMPAILTSDLAPGMIEGAIRHGLPAVVQAAQALILRDKTMDAVIIAYGSHHIPRSQRLLAAQEAFRVLVPGGRFVLHDFENGSPMAAWFENIVDKYSATGHQYDHFSIAEMQSYLNDAGFAPSDVRYVYDPFIVSGATSEESRHNLGLHLASMYGLTKLVQERSREELGFEVYDFACNVFNYDLAKMGLDADFGCKEIVTRQIGDVWVTEMPRIAIVAAGTR